MKKLFFCLCLLAFNYSQAQQTSMAGKITDGETAEELIGANIVLYKNGVLITGTSTDFEGNYTINLDPGTYDVEVSYIGYSPVKITGVVINALKSNLLNVMVGDVGINSNWNSNRRRQQRSRQEVIVYESPEAIEGPVTREELFNKPDCDDH